MDANELMIGDLVNGWDGRWHPVCVSTISSYPEHRPTIVACGGYGYSLVDQVQPIQLTTEILEMNYGKETRVGISDKPCWGEMCAIWSTMLWKCENSFWLEVSTIAGGFVKKHILYVHELQHALRLAGIKKEIVL